MAEKKYLLVVNEIELNHILAFWTHAYDTPNDCPVCIRLKNKLENALLVIKPDEGIFKNE